MFSSVVRKILGGAVVVVASVVAPAQNQALLGSVNPQSGYIDLAASPLLAPPSITIEAWITYDDSTIPSGWVYPTIARKNFTQGVSDWFLRVDAGNNNTKRLRLWVNGLSGVVNVNWSFNPGALTNWTHVAATYDGSFGRLYINGVQVAQSAGTGPLVDTGLDARIGAGDTAPGSANERWNGLIDELRIWSVARTQTEIAAAMSQQILSAPNLSASYQLNGNGLDASGNNLHGTLVANPTFVTVNSPVGPNVYCTAGTTSIGCVPSISGNAQPNVGLNGSCVISVASVEGQKSGLIFYGIDNTAFTPLPWATGSTSFLCVKPPTQRMIFQSSGGSIGACDGALVQDVHVYLSGNPAALGQPFTAGARIYAQAWYRDPAAVKTTNLSNALELTVQP